MTDYDDLRNLDLREEIIERADTDDNRVSPLQVQTHAEIAYALTGVRPKPRSKLDVMLDVAHVTGMGDFFDDGREYFVHGEYVAILETWDERGDRRPDI